MGVREFGAEEPNIPFSLMPHIHKVPSLFIAPAANADSPQSIWDQFDAVPTCTGELLSAVVPSPSLVVAPPNPQDQRVPAVAFKLEFFIANEVCEAAPQEIQSEPAI
jgi:hypothetical protein